MATLKLYLEDSLGNRVLVDTLDHANLDNDIRAKAGENKDKLFAKVGEARDSLMQLHKPKPKEHESDFDILTKLLFYTDMEAKEIIARNNQRINGTNASTTS